MTVYQVALVLGAFFLILNQKPFTAPKESFNPFDLIHPHKFYLENKYMSNGNWKVHANYIFTKFKLLKHQTNGYRTQFTLNNYKKK